MITAHDARKTVINSIEQSILQAAEQKRYSIEVIAPLPEAVKTQFKQNGFKIFSKQYGENTEVITISWEYENEVN